MSAILAISNKSGKYAIDGEIMAGFMEKIFPDQTILRKLKFIWRETSIIKKYTVIPDFNPGCTDPQLYKNGENPSTSDRLHIYEKEAVELGKSASLDVINKTGLAPGDITHIITVSCTGMFAPGLEARLVEELELDPSVKRFTVNFMGCYAAFHGMRLADLICKDAPDSKVLVVCVELCTLHLRNDPSDDNLLSTALFSDGASAFIVGNPKDNKQPYLECKSFDSAFIPEGKEDMAWKIGDMGFEMVLSRNIPAHIEKNMSQAFDRLIEKNKLNKEDIRHYAIHPGGKNILKAFEKSLQISKDELANSFKVLSEYGNMSSATVMFVLSCFLDNYIATEEDQHVYAAAFGPGLTIESGLFILKGSNE